MATELLAPQLPVTGTFALPISAYYIFLQSRVVYHRLKSSQIIEQPAASSKDESDPFTASVRSQINFAENVPLALALAAIVELNGGSKKVLTGVLSALFVARVLHADLGIMLKGYMGYGRPAGYYVTQGLVAGLAGWGAYLSKGFWGY